MVEEKSPDGGQEGGLSPRVWLWIFRAALALIVVLVFRPIVVQEGLVPFIFGLVMLNFVIVVHELGHLLVALHVGVPAEVFSIGFGPALLRKHWRGIEWRVSVIPCGGFVELGERVRERHQFLIAAAGPVASLLFGFLSMAVAGMLGGASRKVEVPLTVAHASPIARAAGLRPGDVLASIEGVDVKEHTRIVFKRPRGANDVRSSAHVVVKRGDTTVDLDVPLEYADNSLRLGINFKETPIRLSAQESLTMAGRATSTLASQPLALPIMLAREPKRVADSVTGPGGVVQLASGAYTSTPAHWLCMVGLLSGAIGGFQLLPLMPLDGGRMIEAILRRSLRAAKAEVRMGVITTYSVSTFLLILAMVVVGLTRDIFR